MLEVEERPGELQTTAVAVPQQEAKEPVLWLVALGRLCYLFAIVDLGFFFLADTDITGVWWSPPAALLLGSFLIWLAKPKSANEVEEQDQ